MSHKNILSRIGRLRASRSAGEAKGRVKRSSLLLLSGLLPTGLLVYAAAQPMVGAAKPPKSKQAAAKPLAAPATSGFETEIAPLVRKYCIGCHTGLNPSGGVSVTNDKTMADVLKSRGVWENISRNIADNHMPPAAAPQPTPAERDKITGWVESTFTKADCALHDPGRITLRRLNREEYNNTIRDIFGVDMRIADSFPADDVGYGFDNIGDVLSLSPLLMEKYLNAAEKVAQTAILTPEDGNKPQRFPAATMQHTLQGSAYNGNGFLLYTAGDVHTEVDIPRDGDYTIRVNAAQQAAGPDNAQLALHVDDKVVFTFDVAARERNPRTFELPVNLKAGKHRFAMEFTNDFYDEKAVKGKQDRNLVVNYMELVGPPGLPKDLPASHKRIVFVTPSATLSKDEAARKILTAFAAKAYRRPATTQEVDRLLTYVHLAQKQGESFEGGIRVAIEAALVNPNFLFHVELDPKPNEKKVSRYLTDYELASRLSYFLWSSGPDQELMSLAAQGKLQNSKMLQAQVKRMLKDPKAQALGQNFAGQWLQLRNLSQVRPDTARFPDWNDKLRLAMKTETEMFFNAIVNEDRSLLDFIDAKYTFLNEPLAKHYGIAGVTGDNFRRIALEGDQRGGLLTQASILTVTSNPTRTSPVKRGKWVLDNLLGTPPPPAPPNVPKLADDNHGPLVGTLRQRMEQHRKDPACASCHARMDPLGFGLENFDATGGWRVKDGDQTVDASGTLPGNVAFSGPAQLKTILKTKKTLFVHCLTEKMMTYALGRGIEHYDRCNIDAMVKSIAQNDYKFSALINAIVESDPFRKRRGDDGGLATR
jgi:hypothetical protein